MALLPVLSHARVLSLLSSSRRFRAVSLFPAALTPFLRLARGAKSRLVVMWPLFAPTAMPVLAAADIVADWGGSKAPPGIVKGGKERTSHTASVFDSLRATASC
jgi:hypothetical protein